MSEPVIRAALARDLPAVRDIFNHYVRETTITFVEYDTDLAYWQEALDDCAERGFPFLVAVEGERVLGYALVRPWSARTAYRFTVENSIYLDPSETGRGVGRALLAALIEASRAAGLAQIIAIVSGSGAEGSLALHTKAGFVEVGHLRDVGFKFDRWLDVHNLQLSL